MGIDRNPWKIDENRWNLMENVDDSDDSGRLTDAPGRSAGHTGHAGSLCAAAGHGRSTAIDSNWAKDSVVRHQNRII